MVLSWFSDPVVSRVHEGSIPFHRIPEKEREMFGYREADPLWRINTQEHTYSMVRPIDAAIHNVEKAAKTVDEIVVELNALTNRVTEAETKARLLRSRQTELEKDLDRAYKAAAEASGRLVELASNGKLKSSNHRVVSK
jgi:hypothetical protein